MINGYQTDILKIYSDIRDYEEKELRVRRERIEKVLPLALELERKIGKLCIELSVSAFKNIENREEYLEQLKNKITDLRIQKSELLVQNGFDMNYLSLHYQCPKCNDTGFIINEKCSCYNQKLVNLYYQNSDLKDIIRDSNFDNFDLNLYSNQKSGSEHESPRKNMEKTLSTALNFLSTFKNGNENLLFYGNSGTGKTFLSYCIAKELLDKGILVVYRTSDELIQNLKTIRFSNDKVLEELLINCDLLIIDDLGTEQINDFSKTELFNLINTKLLKGKKMLISTNFTLEDLSRIYSERIISRLFGNFTLRKFYGDDIRVKKNLARLR